MCHSYCWASKYLSNILKLPNLCIKVFVSVLFISWADSIVDCVLVFRNCLSASSLHPLTWKLPSCQKIIQQIGQNQNIANVTQKYCKSNFLTQMNFIPPDVHKEKATVYLNVCQDLSFGPRKFTLSQIL